MIKHLLVVFAALLTSLNVLAQEDVTFQAKTVEGVDMLFTVISETDKTCRIGDGQNVSIDKSTPGKVTIPQTANGYSVVEVGERAFRGCYDLTAIVIPEGIVTIAKNAFASCYGLLSLNIPASVSSIGERAFGVCYGLNSITVDKGNKNYDSRDDCNALIETATNTLIQGSNSTVIPNGVTAIGEQAFYKMQGIETVAFPEGLVTIGEEAYYGCENLVDVTLSSTVKIVGKESFKETGLKSFTCSPAVVSIGEEAFYGCENLTEVEFSSSLSTLDTDAFENCPKLAKVTSHIKTPFAFDPHVFALRVDDQRMFTPATLYVPAGTKALYEATEGWKEFTKIVEMEIIANGVKNVKSSKAADGQLYNLYGQKVSSNRKGILVSNGKKVLKK